MDSSKRFGTFLSSIGFKTSEADSCLHIRTKNGKKLMVALYVDDGLVVATDMNDANKFI